MQRSRRTPGQSGESTPIDHRAGGGNDSSESTIPISTRGGFVSSNHADNSPRRTTGVTTDTRQRPALAGTITRDDSSSSPFGRGETAARSCPRRGVSVSVIFVTNELSEAAAAATPGSAVTTSNTTSIDPAPTNGRGERAELCLECVWIMKEREKYRPPERRRQARRVKFVLEIVRDCPVLARRIRRQSPPMARQTPANPVEVRRFSVVDSTNRLAQDAIRAGGIDHPVAFVAERQVAGQGRAGRAWHSPSGGLWCTSIWPVASADAPRLIDGLGLRVGVACHAAIEGTLRAADSTRHAQLKWPNDILVNAKKVSGCLCRVERAPTSGTTWLLIGVGINANNNPDELGADLRRAPTSLARETAGPIDLDELLRTLLVHLARAVAAPGLPADWLAAARAALFGVGAETEVATPTDAPIRGTLLGLDDRGQLIIETPIGRTTIPQAVELNDPPRI